MNPLFLVLLLGGGYYLYQKQKKESERPPAALCTEVNRHGMVLLCDGGACLGLAAAPDVSDPDYQIFWGELAGRSIDDVMQGSNVAATDAQAREIVIRIYGSVFPECNWSALPLSTPIAEGTLGAVIEAIKMMTSADAAVPDSPPIAGEEVTVDRNGFRLSKVGPVCVRLTTIEPTVAAMAWADAMSSYVAQFKPSSSWEDASNALAVVIRSIFPECSLPSAAEQEKMTFVDEEGHVSTWPDMVIGIQIQLSAPPGQAMTTVSQGTLGKLGQLALTQGGG
jgi:hypothetical protein